MKKWKIVLILLILGNLAFAATPDDSDEEEEEEETPDAQVFCFKAEGAVPPPIGDTFCFTNPTIVLEDRTLNFTEATEGFPSIIPLQVANKKAGGQVQFEAMTRLVDQWGAECNSQYAADLKIYGETTWDILLKPNDLTMELYINRSDEKCGEVVPEKINYILVP